MTTVSRGAQVLLPRIAAKRTVARISPRSRPFGTIQRLRQADGFKAEKIPVVSFQDSERLHREITVSDEPVPVKDTRKIAVGLTEAIVSQLTPTMRKFTLFGKVAVVTGAARGLGYSMAQGLAEVGVCGIAIFDFRQDFGEAAAKDLTHDTGVDTRFYKVDVTDEKAVAQAVADVVAHYGHIDVLINSAGIADSNIKAEDYPTDKFRRLIDINLNGTFLVTQAVARAMMAAKTGGSVINIASMSGSIVNFPQEQCCYNASKAGVIQLTRSLAAEWAKHHIRVNAISPGYMDTELNRVPALDAQKKIWTDLTPQKRLGDVDDLNNLAVYLASDGSRFMTGNNCIIDGGYSLW